MAVEKVFFDLLIGKTISHIWRGHGSALFVEFGELVLRTKRKNGEPADAQGEMTLMIQWSWRIEKARSILTGSWGEERCWPACFNQLRGTRVNKVELFGALPEILVWLDNGMRIASFMTADGQPSWALIARRPQIGRAASKPSATPFM